MFSSKTFCKMLIGLALICAGTTQLIAKEPAHPQQQKLISELQVMLTRPYDAFVVVQIAGTEKFIQFYSETSGLFIDLPAVALTVEENKRADVFFRENDIPQVAEEATDPETGKDFTLIVWRQAFENDQAAKVAELSLRALRNIYLIPPNSELEIIKGWD